jgi:hypothetical protein
MAAPAGAALLSSPWSTAVVALRHCGLRSVASGDSLACYAVATDIKTNQELKGPTITMAMAKKEGWATKAGSKWLTMA